MKGIQVTLPIWNMGRPGTFENEPDNAANQKSKVPSKWWTYVP